MALRQIVKEGDSVKKGDPLLKYDITALELDLKQKENKKAVRFSATAFFVENFLEIDT